MRVPALYERQSDRGGEYAELVFRKNDLAVLTSDVYFSVSEVSAGFSARYVALSEPMLEAAYYRITSVSLWDYLHHVPILRLSPEQRSLVSGWLEQIEWILTHLDGPDRSVLLNNNIYHLLSPSMPNSARLSKRKSMRIRIGRGILLRGCGRC